MNAVFGVKHLIQVDDMNGHAEACESPEHLAYPQVLGDFGLMTLTREEVG